jgi:hypothetical protein
MDSTIVAMFLTAASGILALAIKTKREVKNPESKKNAREERGFWTIWNSLTWGGYVAFFLILGTTWFATWSKLNDDDMRRDDKIRLSEKARTDSVNYIHELERDSNFYIQEQLVDSIHYLATLNALSSEKISEADRFKLTLFKFEQTLLGIKETVQKQNLMIEKQTEIEIITESIKHPLTPLSVNLKYSACLDAKQNDKLIDECNGFQLSPGYKPDPKARYPGTAKEYRMVNGSYSMISYSNFSPNDTNTYDSAFTVFHKHICSLLPRIEFYFYSEDSLPFVSALSSDIYWNLSGSYFYDTINHDLRITYTYNPNDGTIMFDYSFKNPPLKRNSNEVNSMYDIWDGFLVIGIQGSFTNIALLNAKFQSENEDYSISYSGQDKRNYRTPFIDDSNRFMRTQEFYIKKGSQIIQESSRNDQFGGH